MTVRPLTPRQEAILDRAWAEGLNGRDKLHAQVRASHPEAGITQRQVAAYLRTNQPHQLFIYQRKTKPVTVIRRSRPLQLATVDLTALPPQPAQSGGGKGKEKLYYKWITVVIDAFSRYAWVGVLDPMSSDTGPTAAEHWKAFWPILQEIRDELGGTNADLRTLQIQSDNGNEMEGRFHTELTKRGIKHTYGKPGAPASQSHVERLNQTLKNKLKRLWRAQGKQTKKPWNADLLQAVVASYNNQIHSALPKPYTPSDVLDALDDDPDDIIPVVLAHQKKLFDKKKGHYEVQWQGDSTPGQLEVGDVVRKRSVQPGKYDTQYSVTLYTVAKVTKPKNDNLPVTYRLRKRGGTKLESGNFSIRDLQRVPVDAAGNPVQRAPARALTDLGDTSNREYAPQRIVAERQRAAGRELLVRWKGYRASEATWTPEAELAGTDVLDKWDAG
jgi:transposase InsO family protein